MGRSRKSAVYENATAAILAENIYERLPKAFKSAGSRTNQIAALARRCGISPETIRRIAQGEVSPQLRQLNAIAEGLGCMVWELLKASEAISSAPSAGDRPFKREALDVAFRAKRA